MKYVVISNGKNAFYNSDINTSIPTGALQISDSDYDKFFSSNGTYIFSDVSGVATIGEVVTSYVASNYGTTVKPVKGSYTAETGEVVFSSHPTETDLKTAFPTTAAVRTFPIVTNAVTNDTLSVLGQLLTFGTTVPIGDIIESTVTNIVSYLNTLKVITGNYKVIANGASIVVSEAFAGGGISIPEATTTGTIKVTNGALTESVWGYSTQIKHEQKVALEASAETIRETYRKNYIGAMAKGDTAGAQAILDSITTLNNNLYEAMEAINNG